MDSKIGTSDDKGNAATTCHMLPCNIDYEGMATTHLHFKPAELEDGILASTFRGRGLLAAARQKNDGGDDNNDVVTVKAHLLSLEGDQIILKVCIFSSTNIKSLVFTQATDSLTFISLCC